jgi:hypothetical protein
LKIVNSAYQRQGGLIYRTLVECLSAFTGDEWKQCRLEKGRLPTAGQVHVLVTAWKALRRMAR